jgi:hypothetical protein
VVKNLAAGAAEGATAAQGIGAVSFFAAGKKDTSVKSGPRAVLPYGQVGARMRPELTLARQYKIWLVTRIIDQENYRKLR